MLIVSVAVLPGWPLEWLRLVSGVRHMRAPLLTPLGFLIPAVLLRWRRSESWLLIAGAAMPQTLMWYGGLMPLAIADTYRQACILSLISTLGYLASNGVVMSQLQDKGAMIWTIFTASVYLPAVVLVLSRPRDAHSPAFLQTFAHRRAVVA